MRLSSKFSKVCLWLAAIVLLTAQVSHAAPSRAAAKPRKAPANPLKQITQAANAVLVGTRNLVNAQYLRFKAVEDKRPEIENSLASLNQQKIDADVTHSANATALTAAIDEVNVLNARALVIPYIVSLHSFLLSFVDRYKDQAGTNPLNTAGAINGDVFQIREAIGYLIDSHRDDLAGIRDILESAKNELLAIQGEFLTLSQTDTPPQYGFDHYFTVINQRLESQKTIATSTIPFFSGKDIDGRPLLPKLPCQLNGSTNTPTFQATLTTLNNSAQAATGNQNATALNGWSSGPYTEMTYFYDGHPITRNPGIISHFGACYGTKEVEANVLRNDIERAISEERFDLAASLDFQLQDLNALITLYRRQQTLIINQRGRIGTMLNAATTHAGEFETKYPRAWKQIVNANVSNLNEAAKSYPGLLKAEIELIKKVQAEIPGLAATTDLELRKAKLAQVSDKYKALLDGFNALLNAVDSALDNLYACSINARSGPFGLKDAIDQYASASKKKFDDLNFEEDVELPKKQADAEAKLDAAQDNFDRSFNVIRELNIKIKSIDGLTAQLNAMAETLGRVFVTSFNPIYSEILDLLLEPVAETSQWRKYGAPVKSKLQGILNSFNGVTAASAKAKGSSSASAAAQKKFASAINRQKGVMMKALPDYLAQVSESYLDGNSLELAVDEYVGIFEEITGIPEEPVEPLD